MLYLLYCSSFDLFYDEARHHKHLNIFFSCPCQVTPLTHKSNFRISLGSKPEKLENIENRQNVGHSLKKVCIGLAELWV